MRRATTLVAGFLTLLLIAGAPGVKDGAAASDKAVGTWHGLLDTGGGKLTIIVEISEGEAGALSGVLETPDQAPGKRIPITTVTSADGRLNLDLQDLAASYEAIWSDDEEAWSGLWKQSGLELPLGLTQGRPAPKAVIEGMDGFWEGTVTRNGKTVRLNVSIATGNRGTIALFGSPDFAISDLPVENLAVTDGAVSFIIPATGARYSGHVSEDGNSMSGTWMFPGRTDSEVTFVRTRTSAEKPKRPRPQLPEQPLGYDVEDVTFQNPDGEGVVLAGTLTLPKGPGPFPAAILISGSGPQDRDETIFDHKPFAVLADHLTRNGIAVLRHDDRGFGASTGSFGDATSEDFAADANAATHYLLTRPRIDRNAIGFIGHSEGGIIAPLAVRENADIDFIVMLAGPGTNLTEISLAQRRMFALMQGVSEEEIARTEPLLRDIYEAIATSSTRKNAEESIRPLLTASALQALGASEERRELVIRQVTGDWHRFLLQYNPAETLPGLDVAVLALNGSLDLQVPADANLAAIKAALADNPDATVMKLDGLNHLFQTAETGAIGEYGEIAETFSPVALDVISGWIKQRF